MTKRSNRRPTLVPTMTYSAQQALRCFYFHTQEITRLEREVQRLTDFKAEFENLAESSIDDSEPNGNHGNGGDGGAATGATSGGDEKWKLRVKKLQKYVKWQLAEAENQVRFVPA